MSRRGRLVAASLTVLLLFCHGAFGALHQASMWPVGHSGGHHAPAAPPASIDHQTGQHGGSVAHADYSAALFVFLFGAAVLALFFAWSPTRSRVVDARLLGRIFAPFYLRPPRAPTPALLQVFRL